MSLHGWTVFALLWVVFVTTPGPNAVNCIQNGMAYGASQPARGSAAERDRLPEELFFALVLMERDAERARYGPTSQRALEELVKLLAERDLETLRHTWRTLFSRIVEPAEDTRRAAELVGEHFRTS
jgi:hypothetical protein